MDEKQIMLIVAAYCRVSTDGKDQLNSFAAQQRFFREYINKEQDWMLYDIYADEGITGTSTKKRSEFNRMIDDARNGKFQLILTKEVSRFARNTLDAIYYTRELRTLGVGVLFMSDGIHTLEPDSELRLSILGSIAQEESRRTSQRVKWGQTRQMEQGIVFGHSLLGYDLHDGILTIEPQGAAVVKMIFRRYTQEKQGSAAIAQELSKMTGKNWTPSQVVRVLKNEKYAGDLVQKKTYTPDYLTHEKKKNNGAEPLIVLQNHHAPIIERSLWDKTQAELQRRSRRSRTNQYISDQYALSGKIYCGKCGNLFVSRTKRRKDGSIYRRWRCKNSHHCGIGKTLNDSLAKDAVIAVIRTLLPDYSELNANQYENDLIIRYIVDRITVYPDRRLELLLVSQTHAITFFFV